MVAYDATGHVIARLQLLPLRDYPKYRQYFDLATYTFGIAITQQRIEFFRP